MRVLAAIALVAAAFAAAGPAAAGPTAPSAPKLAPKAPEPGAAERARVDARLRRLVGKPPPPIVNLHNIWTHETLVLAAAPAAPDVDPATFDTFLRCHFTDEATHMDGRLLGVLAAAAKRFSAARIDIVSGFRSPKFNLMLRKKGHEVARDSQHTYGHAVDFRIPGVGTRSLVDFVRGLALGGAGYYPESEFVHADTGPIRTWAGR
jgi:uncharacterized protein YcbK (DUF882 family)